MSRYQEAKQPEVNGRRRGDYRGDPWCGRVHDRYISRRRPSSLYPRPRPRLPLRLPPRLNVARLTFTASVTRRRPFVGNKAGVFVSAVPGARITVVAHLETGDRRKTARADDSGLHTFWFPTGSIPSWVPGRCGHPRIGERPEPLQPDLVHSAPAAPAATRACPHGSAAPPAPSGCFPKASTGNCYEPGEFCPHADAGMRGVAGDGKDILCEDNNGLRWEPV